MTEDPRTVTLPGGAEMPLLGFGTWQVSGRRGQESIRQALETGYRHLDTATMYANEAEVGRAVRDSGVPREQVFITTKMPAERARRARATLGESLRKLAMEYVDLWLIHWPVREGLGVDTWREFLAARDAGLCREVGVSNYSIAELDELIDGTGEAPAVNQVRWGPSIYDGKRVAQHSERGVVLEGYSPFKTANLRDRVLREIADAHGKSPAQVVLRWHLEHRIVVIPKSDQADRIRSNFDVFDFSLTPDEVARIDAL
jgi:diketogulonate reductase-like aldo/keto reductase